MSINAADGTESDCKNLTGSHPAVIGVDTLSFLGYEGKMNDRVVAMEFRIRYQNRCENLAFNYLFAIVALVLATVFNCDFRPLFFLLGLARRKSAWRYSIVLNSLPFIGILLFFVEWSAVSLRLNL